MNPASLVLASVHLFTVDVSTDVRLLGLLVVGLVGGLILLVRGFGAYRRAMRIGDTATSRISGLAVGEVRVSGTVEVAEVELVSALESLRCVYYRAQVVESRGRNSRTVFAEERSIGFRVRDDSGSVRVFPFGATWDVPDRLGSPLGFIEGPPIGLNPRTGPAIRYVDPGTDGSSGDGQLDDLAHAAAVAELLTVHRTRPNDALDAVVNATSGYGQRYEEAVLELGDVVTVVGTVLPFSELPDPTGADGDSASGGSLGAASADPEIAADLEAARQAGTLAADPATAWGNAAIPGFGIGRPVVAPELDPAATAPVIVPDVAAAAASAASRRFDIAPETLVLAAGVDAPLLIAAGTPGASESRADRSFVVGLVGAIMAIASATTLAVLLSGATIR